MCIGETLWVPLCTYEHPTGAHTGPQRGPVKLRFIFRSRTVSLRLPGSLPHPSGVVYQPLRVGIRYVTQTLRVCVPDPNGVRLSYVLFFVVARSAFGFPAPYHTLRVWYTNPFGLVYATLHKPFGFVYRTRWVRYHTFGVIRYV